MNPLTLALDIAATYRLTKLVMEDKVTEDFRNYIYEKFPRDSKVSYFVGCPWCISIWGAAVLVILRKISPEAANAVSTILAASAVTGVAYTRGL